MQSQAESEQWDLAVGAAKLLHCSRDEQEKQIKFPGNEFNYVKHNTSQIAWTGLLAAHCTAARAALYTFTD